MDGKHRATRVIMELSATFFKNRFDNETGKRLDFEDFDKFSRFLFKLSKRPLKGKNYAELFSPAVYTPDSKRRNANVLAWAGWAAIDIDDIKFSGDLKEELYNRLGECRYVVYSTASSKKEQPKFRIVFELDRHIRSEEIKHFWFALQSKVDDQGDKQCKDLSRMYYIPGDYLGAYNFIFENKNKALNVSELLSNCPYNEKKNSKNFLDRLPDDFQKKLIQYRMDNMSNKRYSWQSYEDCPFVNKSLIRDYKSIAYTDNSGRYAMIYKIMTSIAINAIKKEYPIAAHELSEIIKQLDRDTSNRYENRALDVEADRAIEYAYRNA